LTAEEIAQRRGALKRRLAEKKEHHVSQDSASATSELSYGNTDCFKSNLLTYWLLIWYRLPVVFECVCVKIV